MESDRDSIEDRPTASDAADPAAAGPSTGRWRASRKLLALLAVAALFALVYTQLGESLSLKALAAREATLNTYRQQHPHLIYLVAFAVYVAVTGLSLPGATVLTLALAWFFGFWRAVILVSFASTTGATIAFLLSRYFLRETIQRKFGKRLAGFNRALVREGTFYLFTLRLIPAVPFFVLNAVMGLTPIPLGRYWWVSQLGMLPGTCVYVYAGSAVPTAQALIEKGAAGILSPRIFFAFVLLGLFPIVVKKIMARVRRPPAESTE